MQDSIDACIKRPTVLITGASTGIGRATALAFATRGWRVAATMRHLDDAGDLASIPGIRLFCLDVTDPDRVKYAVHEVIIEFGRLDAVVNNAGFSVDGVFEAMTDAVIRRQFETNVHGVMRVTREVIPVMRRQGGGTIVQLSSIGGRACFPFYSIYHATKWALEGFSEALAMELRPFGIRIRMIEPGVINSDFYGRSRETVEPPGDGSYDALVSHCQAISLGASKHGAMPAVVAETIVRSVLDQSWRLRYPVAKPAPQLIRLRKLLPESLFLWLIRRHYGIPRVRSLI